MRKMVGIIGYPLGHSISPAMHNAAFKKLDLDFEYLPFEIKEKDLPEVLQGFRALHVAGFNVTIPYKETVVPLLDEVTELAKIIGAVNTVVNREGLLVGYNTDGAGFIESLKEDGKIDPAGKTIVLLGAGGAAHAVSVTLAEAKAGSLTVVDIQAEKAKELAEYVGAYFDMKCQTAAADSQELQKAIDQADLLVNSTPIGMHPKIGASPISDNIKLHPKLFVYDLVYNPAETKLMKKAKAAGGKTCGGLGMLVRQGALAFTLWTGEEAPLQVMRKAAEASLK